MTCPQCNQKIPAKAVWQAMGLSGLDLDCPHCNASLSTSHWRPFILLILSFGAGYAAQWALERRHAGFVLSNLAFLVVTVAVYPLLAGPILRLRVKPDSLTILSHGKG
jgi:hypothetical protein